MLIHSFALKNSLEMNYSPLFFNAFTIIMFFSFALSSKEAATDLSTVEGEDQWAQFDDYTDTEDSTYQTQVHGLTINNTDYTTSAAQTIDVSEQTSQYSSVASVIKQSVGMQVRQSGGPDSFGTISIRGSNSSQVSVFIDEILLNKGGFSSINTADLNLDLLDSIEIYRGSVPVSLGLGNIGGAVVLRTKKHTEPVSEFALTYGSWKTRRALALHSSNFKNTNLLLISSTRAIEGDFKYLNRNGTPLNPDDDEIIPRRNNAHFSQSSLLKISRTIKNTELTLLNDLFFKKQGLAGIDSLPTTSASLQTLRELAAVTAELQATRKLNIKTGLNYIFQLEKFDDQKNEIGIGHQNTVSKTHAISGFGLWQFAPLSSHLFDLRLDVNLESFQIEDTRIENNYDPSKRSRLLYGAAYTYKPIDTLKIVPSIRIMTESSNSIQKPGIGEINPREISWQDSFVLPALGLKWQLTDSYSFLSNAGYYVRTPDLYELYGDRGTSVGNVNLVAEEGFNADAGMNYAVTNGSFFSSARLYLGVFGTWSQNLITYVQNSQNTIRAENVDSARAMGIESSLAINLKNILALEANYTYLQTENRSEKPFHFGKQLPGRPRHNAFIKPSLNKRFSTVDVTFWTDVEYSGKNYLDQANLKEEVLGKTLLNAGYKIEHIDWKFTITIEVLNLLDTIILLDADGNKRPLRDYEAFPQPGRTILLTLNKKI